MFFYSFVGHAKKTPLYHYYNLKANNRLCDTVYYGSINLYKGIVFVVCLTLCGNCCSTCWLYAVTLVHLTPSLHCFKLKCCRDHFLMTCSLMLLFLSCGSSLATCCIPNSSNDIFWLRFISHSIKESTLCGGAC